MVTPGTQITAREYEGIWRPWRTCPYCAAARRRGRRRDAPRPAFSRSHPIRRGREAGRSSRGREGRRGGFTRCRALANARSSLLSAVFGVSKATLVQAVMSGTAPEDLWIAHWTAARSGRGTESLRIGLASPRERA